MRGASSYFRCDGTETKSVLEKKLNESYEINHLALFSQGKESNSVLLDQNHSLVCRRILRGSLQRWKDVSCWTLPLHRWKNWRHMRDNWYVFT